MENRLEISYDCAITGGGLAGLCLAIQLADSGFSVILFEKNEYPFHKVCGEYISMESHNFLSRIGFPFQDFDLPRINELSITSEPGFSLNHKLKLGGFGISRYTLDYTLSQLAVKKGVILKTKCRVSGIQKHGDVFNIESTGGSFAAKIVCGSYGKYAPQFLNVEKQNKGTNYIGVKYHIRTDLPANKIELHNFHDGYCGISKVEGEKYCLCYLTTAANLQKNDKDILQMEAQVLYKNPFLKRYFTTSEFINRQPLVISNVHFEKRQTETDGIFLLGDAAGSITPLCGNGMSMGMRASYLLAKELELYLAGKQSMEMLHSNYRTAWNANFKNRISAGYYLQHVFGKKTATDLALKFLSKTPMLMDKLVSLTHGQPF